MKHRSVEIMFAMTKRSVAALVAVAALSSPAVPRRHAARTESLAITHVEVIDCADPRPSSDMTVVIESGHITAIGKTAELEPPPGSRILDATGQFLLPGLWDMHVHAFQSTRTEEVLRVFLANGVLGIRDMGCAPDRFAELRAWRDGASSGRLLSPRIVASGPMLDGARPIFPETSIAVTSESEAREAVDRIAMQGADFVKVYSVLSRDSYFAIAGECRRLGISFSGHVPDSVSAAEASDAGQKSIEHLSGISLACSTVEAELRQKLLDARAQDDPLLTYRALLSLSTTGVHTYDKSKAADLYSRFVRNGTWQVPTLVVTRRTMPVDDPPIAVLSRLDRRREAASPVNGNARARVARRGSGSVLAANGIEPLLSLVRDMRAAGVRFMTGTDAPSIFAPPGVSMHTELELLVKAGFTPMEALQAATIEPARYLGLEDQLGTVRTGKIADLILLDGDPLVDIRNTRRIAAVIVRGTFIAASELQDSVATVAIAEPFAPSGFDLTAQIGATRSTKQTSRHSKPAPSPEQILEAEQRLSALGYWTGPIDGVADDGFKHALIAFQKVEGRARTGRLDSPELEALRSAKPPSPSISGYRHIEIDLKRQVLFVVDTTQISGILPISTGTGRFFTESGRTRRACTPCGQFKIYRKLAGWHKSPLGRLFYPNYFHGGVAIHGSALVPATPASHGCIRIPMFAAKRFSEITPTGTIVIVYDEAQPKP